VLDGLLGDLDPSDWRARPVAPEWAPIEIICHLRDEEVEDFGARIRVALEGGSRFTPIDPERWAEERRYRDADPREALAAFRERREASLGFLASVPPDRLTAAVEHPRLRRLSGLDLLVAWVLPAERMHAAWERGRAVGGAGAFPFELTVPGGRVPAAGVSVVGVLPTHRRRGILKAMMRAQLDACHARGEPVACLWATEDTIYGRFGYGIASFTGEIELPRERSAYATPFEPSGEARIVSLEG